MFVVASRAVLFFIFDSSLLFFLFFLEFNVFYIRDFLKFYDICYLLFSILFSFFPSLFNCFKFMI